MTERRKFQAKHPEVQSNVKEGGVVAVDADKRGTHKVLLTFKDGDSTQLLALDNPERGLVLDNFDEVVTISVMSTPTKITVSSQQLTYLEVANGTTHINIISCPLLAAIKLPSTCVELIVTGPSVLRQPVGFLATGTIYKNEQLKNKFYTIPLLK